MAMKPKAPKPMGSGRKNQPTKPRAVKLPGTPAPLAEYKPRRVPGQPLPAPMPKVQGNLTKPKDQRAQAKQVPAGPKKKSPTFKFPRPKKKM